MPFLDGGGPCGARTELADAPRGTLLDEARRGGRPRSSCAAHSGWPSRGEPMEHKVNMTLSLPADADRCGASSTAACATRSGRRTGRAVRRPSAGREQLDAFYGFFAERMRDLGSPVHARRLFPAMLRRLREPRARRAGAAGARRRSAAWWRSPSKTASPCRGPPARGVPPALPEHAALLGDPSRRLRGRLSPLRLRPLDPRLRHLSLQASVGRTGGAALLVHDPDSGRPRPPSTGTGSRTALLAELAAPLPLSVTRQRRPARPKVPDPMILRVAFIGAGQMAGHHLTAAPADRGSARVVVGVHDRPTGRRGGVRRARGAARRSPRSEALLGETRPDIVHVCTPPGAHFEAAIGRARGRRARLCREAVRADGRATRARSSTLARSRQRLVCAGHQLLRDPRVRDA